MPHLSSLSLTFDASDYTLLKYLDSRDFDDPTDVALSDPSFSAFDREPFK